MAEVDLMRMNRRLVFKALLIAIPVELVALVGLVTNPIDVGYDAATPGWLQFF